LFFNKGLITKLAGSSGVKEANGPLKVMGMAAYISFSACFFHSFFFSSESTKPMFFSFFICSLQAFSNSPILLFTRSFAFVKASVYTCHPFWLLSTASLKVTVKLKLVKFLT